MAIELADIQAASLRIAGYTHKTPIFTSTALNNLTGATLFFKCENLQKVGAFKIRGATNAVSLLTPQQANNGVATHSSGNHAAALALAAKNRKIPAYIVMPKNSPTVKKQAVEGYGAQITFCEPTMSERENNLKKIIDITGATFIHPYDNENIIAGQGTIALEILDQCANLDMVVIPIGGGGLIAGNSIAFKSLAPNVQVIGAEPADANDAYLSFKAKKLILNEKQHTICDGLLMPIGKITFPIILKYVDDIYTASEESILAAMKLIWERMKLIVEPSAAVSLAILLENPEPFKRKNICILLTGGNVDVKTLANLMK